MKMGFVDRSAAGLSFTADCIALGDVTALIVSGTPATFIRDSDDQNDHVVMAINRHGRMAVVQHGHEHVLPDGAAAIFDNRQAGELHCMDDCEFCFLSLPRGALHRPVAEIDGVIERMIPRSKSSLQFLARYLQALFELDQIDDPLLVGMHVADLVVNLIAGQHDLHHAVDRDARTNRLTAVFDAINRHIAEPDLDPAWVARELGYSVGYLHRILKPTGRTFSRHLLQRRLERAHRLLRDPRSIGLKISDVASNAGFADLSHFNRSFRRRYGVTPSAVRAAARGRAG
jgi:AraC-like DNA-binding protein